MSLTDIKDTLIESPLWRTIFSFVLPIITGILSGTFVKDKEIKGTGYFNFLTIPYRNKHHKT